MLERCAQLGLRMCRCRWSAELQCHIAQSCGASYPTTRRCLGGRHHHQATVAGGGLIPGAASSFPPHSKLSSARVPLMLSAGRACGEPLTKAACMLTAERAVSSASAPTTASGNSCMPAKTARRHDRTRLRSAPRVVPSAVVLRGPATALKRRDLEGLPRAQLRGEQSCRGRQCPIRQTAAALVHPRQPHRSQRRPTLQRCRVSAAGF